MPVRTVASWNTLIVAYKGACLERSSLGAFVSMDHEGFQPNKITFVGVIDACAQGKILDFGRLAHEEVCFAGLEFDVPIGTALIKMYGKCGNINQAMALFRKMPLKNTITWNTAITIHAEDGNLDEAQALELSRRMHLHGILPDDTAVTTLLSACSHSGLLDESFRLFGSMRPDFGVDPRIEHYVCVIDLLGRTGQLLEAEVLMSSDHFARLGLEANECAWTAFLGACRDFGDVSRGATAAKEAFVSDPENSGPYMLLSDVCVNSG
ncbi:hypothetical protein SELMODRAFT_92426 [Selaginella moellendorffii]|uniref:Pentacotripeptide-repeat region of PRORP domain-containing protein n=1 Tax=Selaginella moellendorffii TaxID=88036 RepID=D8RFJ2_SELML|nr:hypothetical protein SELMODRAFT_92426 [Selaginella moellendorffii]